MRYLLSPVLIGVLFLFKFIVEIINGQYKDACTYILNFREWGV